jgi:flavodoxin/NAD-dependent dihydropyrimidine dehydrogenase PreA subunit
MKCKIIYFSANGNTKLAAENIEEGVVESGHECEIFEIRDIDEKFDYTCDLLGFMCPVYAYKEPTVFTRYLKKLPNLNGKYAFICATAHSDFGNVFLLVNNLLKKKGIKTIATCKVYCPSSYTVYNTDKLKYVFKETEIQKAFTFGTNLFTGYNEVVVNKSKEFPKFKSKFLKRFLASMISNDFSLSFYLGTIKVDEILCKKCGICAENCAWGAITKKEGEFPKLDKGKCGGCCACINLCPNEALGTKKLKDKIKYHEPSYKGYKKKNL